MAGSAYVLPPQPLRGLAVAGSAEIFPVGRIFCVGRNYAAHAVEMGHDPDREPPFFFLKPITALTTDGIFTLPAGRGEVHHEVEMVVALGKGGAEISAETALDHVFGYGLGLDVTLRDVQAEAKKLGRPWDLAKGFDGSAPCGALTPAARIGHPHKGAVTLKIGGEIRQQGDLAQMIWKTPEILAILSRSFRLSPGDVILTGTPAGVGPLAPGDRILAEIEGLSPLALEVRG